MTKKGCSGIRNEKVVSIEKNACWNKPRKMFDHDVFLFFITPQNLFFAKTQYSDCFTLVVFCSDLLTFHHFLENSEKEKMDMPSKEEIFEGVKNALVEALAVDDDEVTPKATLVGDLGAESIDLLDIVFRLEKTFDIKIERGELVPDDIVNDTQEKYVKDGKLTELGLAEIKKRMPFADLSSFESNPMVQNLTTILTVQDMCYIVEQKLNTAN
jgi:acyl carrier protein